MRINPVRKHWAYVVGEFESAIDNQNAVLDEMEVAGKSISEYETGKLRALTDGLRTARVKKRESRFKFFKQPSRNKHRALIAFLNNQTEVIHKDSSLPLETKAGMLDMLGSWAIEEKKKITYKD